LGKHSKRLAGKFIENAMSTIEAEITGREERIFVFAEARMFTGDT